MVILVITAYIWHAACDPVCGGRSVGAPTIIQGLSAEECQKEADSINKANDGSRYDGTSWVEAKCEGTGAKK